jgi:hypothetical protein
MGDKRMYFRPGNLPSQAATTIVFDEVWTTESYVDTDLNKRRSRSDALAEVSYAYWKDGRFVLALHYASADPQLMPVRVLSSTASPSEIDKFTYKQISGNWFILDSIDDRVSFEHLFQPAKP